MFVLRVDSATLVDICHRAKAAQGADNPILGKWVDPNTLAVHLEENGDNVAGIEEAGLIHSRLAFTLKNEQLQQTNIASALKWLERNPSKLHCVYIVVNIVKRNTRDETSVIPFRLVRTKDMDVESLERGQLDVFVSISSTNDIKQDSNCDSEKDEVNEEIPITKTLTRPISSFPAGPNNRSEGKEIRASNGHETKPSEHATSQTSSEVLVKAAPPPPPKKPPVVATQKKHIRFGYLRKQDRMGFWVTRMVVFDSRQRSLIFASFDSNGALGVPEHIYFHLINRVQLSIYSHRQFEIDATQDAVDLALGTQSCELVTHRFLCDSKEDAIEWIELLHKASPRLAQIDAPPPRPMKPTLSPISQTQQQTRTWSDSVLSQSSNVKSKNNNKTVGLKVPPPPPPPLSMKKTTPLPPPQKVPPPPPPLPVKSQPTKSHRSHATLPSAIATTSFSSNLANTDQTISKPIVPPRPNIGTYRSMQTRSTIESINPSLHHQNSNPSRPMRGLVAERIQAFSQQADQQAKTNPSTRATMRMPRPYTNIEQSTRILTEIYRAEQQNHSSAPVWTLPGSSRPREPPVVPPRITAPGFYNDIIRQQNQNT